MFRSIRINNFKGVRKAELVKLGDINVFIGPNNAGKSTLLQAVALIAQSVEHKVQFKGKFVDVGQFGHAIYRRDRKKLISIELGLDLTKEMKGFRWKKKLLSPVPVTFRTLIGTDGIESQELNCQNKMLRRSQDQIKCHFYKRLTNGEGEILEINDTSFKWSGQGVNVLLGWKVGKPSNVEEKNPFSQKDISFINRLIDGVKERLECCHYFSTVRAIRQWNQELIDVNSFNADGSNAISMLHHVYSNYPSEFKQIAKWIEELGGGSVISGIRGVNSSIFLWDHHVDSRINIVNSGFGINQLLPIIGQCFISPTKSVILIEEPEIHLHPGAIGTLADMLLECISVDRQIFLTTHSDRLILELWARVKLGMIDKNRIALFLVEKTQKGASAKRVLLDTRIEGLRKELEALYEPKGPLEKLVDIVGKSGDDKLSEKDLPQI